MRQMAHLPLLLLGHPRNALLVCFGVGVTADAIRKHESITRVDVVDLNPSVYELNSWFAAANSSVLKDPRLRLFADDGRQYLRLTRERYDFATVEPPPPFMPGIARLYSANYYASLKACLQPGAVVSQWLPDRELDQKGVDLIVATFIDAFPNAFLFVGLGRELILVGSDRPFDFSRVAVSFSQRDEVRADLARLGLVAPYQLLATILRGSESLKTEWQGRPLVRDGFVSLESLMVGIAQAAHPNSAFWAAKSNLFLERADVIKTLGATAPAQIPKVKMLWDFPQADPAYAGIVPANYLLQR
jgi:spermidine synthase